MMSHQINSKENRENKKRRNWNFKQVTELRRSVIRQPLYYVSYKADSLHFHQNNPRCNWLEKTLVRVCPPQRPHCHRPGTLAYVKFDIIKEPNELLIQTLPKKIHRWQLSTWKNTHYQSQDSWTEALRYHPHIHENNQNYKTVVAV